MGAIETEHLITDNVNLVYFLANQWHRKFEPKHLYDYDELVSEGFVGLTKAAKTFDPEKGWKFSTYAGICIRNQILQYARKVQRNQGWIVASLDDTIKDDEGKETAHIEFIAGSEITDDYSFRNELRVLYQKFGNPRKRDHVEEREKVIFELMCRGFRQVEITKMLGLQQRNVAKYQDSIRQRVKELWLYKH